MRGTHPAGRLARFGRTIRQAVTAETAPTPRPATAATPAANPTRVGAIAERAWVVAVIGRV